MMKKQRNMILFCIGFIIFMISFTGCIDTASSSEGINVLITLIPQKEMIESIGGEQVIVTVLVPPGQSPHSYEPSPSQLITISKAQAYFTVGSGVEFELIHLDTIVEQNPHLSVFDCSQGIKVLSYDEHYGKNHPDENAILNEHSGTDPHIWTSPENYIQMAEEVYSGLIEIDPDHQNEYFSNYQLFISKIEQLHVNVSNMLKPYDGYSFMVYHPTWGYFGDTYNLTQLAIEENGKQPGPAGVAAIITQAKEENIKVIFVAPQFDTSSANTIAQEINGEVVYANPLMEDYDESIKHLAEEMVKGFQQQ